MPRAENRKKPTNQSSGMKQGGFQNKSGGGAGSAFGNAGSKKQELLEKMKKQQAERNNQS